MTSLGNKYSLFANFNSRLIHNIFPIYTGESSFTIFLSLNAHVSFIPEVKVKLCFMYVCTITFSTRNVHLSLAFGSLDSRASRMNRNIIKWMNRSVFIFY
jgi:hypothetical protein